MTMAAAANETYSQTSLSLHAPPHLPCDLVEEILCRLPVKHLLQLCCVCKSWNSLISHDSKFAKKHLRLSISTFSHDRHHLALVCSHGFGICNSPISSFFSSEAASTESFRQFSHPLVHPFDGYDRISTCDGMICYTIDESLALLCNPSIRKFKSLPPLINSGPRYSKTLYTLVYDRFIDNYKIIALSSCPLGKKEVNVHTLGTDYWRKIQDFPYSYFCSNPQGIFVSDTFNWLVDDPRSGVSRVIVSLGLAKESYQELLQPLFDEALFRRYDLGVLRDCLCIYSHSCKFSDIWIMKEYGNEKSWTKLCRFPYLESDCCDMFAKPLYIYEDDRVLIRLAKRGKYIFKVYDSKNNTFKTHQFQNSILDQEISKVHVDSLISPY